MKEIHAAQRLFKAFEHIVAARDVLGDVWINHLPADTDVSLRVKALWQDLYGPDGNGEKWDVRKIAADLLRGGK